MKQSCQKALARALERSAQRPEFSLERFLADVTAELLQVEGISAQTLAFIVSEGGTSVCCALAGYSENSFKQKALQCALECRVSQKKFHIVDHNLDTTRFIDPKLGISVTFPVSFNEVNFPFAHGALWFGYGNRSVLNAEIIESLSHSVGQLEEWFCDHGYLINSWSKILMERQRLKSTVRQLTLLAHDIKSPLHSISYALALDAGTVSEATGSISQELNYAMRLLENIGTVSLGSSSDSRSSSEMASTIRKVVNRFQSSACSRGITLTHSTANCRRDGPSFGSEIGMVPLSELVFERVLSNVLGNSIEHTPGGYVQINSICEDDSMIVRISDTGGGIEPRVLEELMDPRSVVLSTKGGWGCGLLSVKHIVEEVGGFFTISSQIGFGSVIEMKFPLDSETHVSSNAAQVTLNEGLPAVNAPSVVLLVDDDPDQLSSLKRILDREGIECRCETTIETAVAVAISTDIRRIICDAHMPDGGARTLLQNLRNRDRSVRIAVLSGERIEKDLYELAAHGAEAFFMKPADVTDLVAWVRRT